METFTNFIQWLDTQHHRLAYEYRLALHRELTHTRRIFPTLTPEVRIMLVQALKEIQRPVMEKWTGDRDGTMEQYYNAPKVDFDAILAGVIESI